MTRYFMRDTPLCQMEQQMMTPPYFKPRGHGRYSPGFQYSRDDMECPYCMNFRRNHPCPLEQCVCLDERIVAGAIDLNEFVRDCFFPEAGVQLQARLERSFNGCSIGFFLSDSHRERWQHWRARCYRMSGRDLAALFLLTAYEDKVAYILGNERYCGDCKYQKTYRDTTVPFKQFRNRGQEDMFYASMTHAPLIDRDTFDKVQLLLKKRQDIFGKSTTQNIYPLTSRIQCSECGSYFRRRQVSGTVKWGCSKHIQDRTQCNSNYYSEERIYDAFVAMVNKLRFSEYDILGQTLLRLESAELKRKQKNTAAREISRNIADLNAKLVMVEQLHAKGYLKDEVHKAQVQEINDQLRRLKRERQCEFSSGITQMIEELTRLKKLLEELEEPLDRFDEKLFTEIVQTISISRRDEMTVTLIGGLRFTEML